MTTPDHPPWCSQRRCTADRPAVNGHLIATHRSAPEASGLTELYLVQTVRSQVPSIEVSRQGVSLIVPLLEAGGFGEAVADLFRAAGVGL